MDLKEFVKETLIQISAGVQESLIAVRQTGGYVNPATRINVTNTDSSHFSSMQNGRQVFLVDFDVTITVEEETGTNAQAKIKVASILSLGAGGESGNKNSAINKISFKVPMALPVDPITEEELKNREAKQAKKQKESISKLGGFL